MNELDYGSLEACKKLAENGIVLETTKYWLFLETQGWWLADKPFDLWNYPQHFPAPTITDVRRELPENEKLLELILDYAESKFGLSEPVMDFKVISVFDIRIFIIDIFSNVDKFIDLLIWYKKKRREEIEKKLLKHAENLKW
jgi:hypothetical protein